MSKKSVLAAMIVFALMMPKTLFAQDNEIQYEPPLLKEDTVWEGIINVRGSVTVPEGKTLTIKENTKIFFHNRGLINVSGVIQAKGIMGKEIVFDVIDEMKEKGEKFVSIRLNNVTSNDSYITGCIIKNAVIAITCTNSSPLIKNNVIEECKIAIELNQESKPKIELNLIKNCENSIKAQTKSAPTITGNYIKNIKYDAVELSQGSHAKIYNNTFSFVRRGVATFRNVVAEIKGNIIKNAQHGIHTYQVGPEEIILANYITNCERAINCDSFSQPIIIGNHLESNVVGILTMQFSAPLIKNNDIVGNSTGIIAYKKCEPIIERNNIFENDTGLYFDFSSYPVVKENNIFDNLYAIKLGNFQSADWEKSRGSANITKGQATAKQSKIDFNKMEKRELLDFIDMQKNYWGEDVTKEMEQKGYDKNISAIYDYYDKNKVTYEGFGDEEYKLDRVKYDNWIKKKIKDCGKKESKDEWKKKPMDIID